MKLPLRIYVASSWRNKKYIKILKQLREAGYNVYDFKNSETAFGWDEIDPNWETWTPNQFKAKLYTLKPHKAFYSDMEALMGCDICILLLPCGKSAHLELGYAVGSGKKTMIFFDKILTDPELTYLIVDELCMSISKILEQLEKWQKEFNKDPIHQKLVDLRVESDLAFNRDEYKELAIRYENMITLMKRVFIDTLIKIKNSLLKDTVDISGLIKLINKLKKLLSLR